MAFTRAEQFSSAGREFILYEGDSWVLFEERGDESEGIGVIHQTDTGFRAIAWWRPGAELHAATLKGAVDQLVAIDPPEDYWPTARTNRPPAPDG